MLLPPSGRAQAAEVVGGWGVERREQPVVRLLMVVELLGVRGDMRGSEVRSFLVTGEKSLLRFREKILGSFDFQ